jgi:hypothetical protein
MARELKYAVHSVENDGDDGQISIELPEGDFTVTELYWLIDNLKNLAKFMQGSDVIKKRSATIEFPS